MYAVWCGEIVHTIVGLAYGTRSLVVADVAMIEPNAEVIRDHVHGDHFGRREGDDICSMTVANDVVAVPMRCVKVVCIAYPDTSPY
jgi:hypothetical protein